MSDADTRTTPTGQTIALRTQKTMKRERLVKWLRDQADMVEQGEESVCGAVLIMTTPTLVFFRPLCEGYEMELAGACTAAAVKLGDTINGWMTEQDTDDG